MHQGRNRQILLIKTFSGILLIRRSNMDSDRFDSESRVSRETSHCVPTFVPRNICCCVTFGYVLMSFLVSSFLVFNPNALIVLAKLSDCLLVAALDDIVIKVSISEKIEMETGRHSNIFFSHADAEMYFLLGSQGCSSAGKSW